MGVLKQLETDRSFLLCSTTLLGRRASCDVHIDDPRVSSEHAKVYWCSDRWELRDLGSRNGTRVDGRRLGAGARVALAPGAVFFVYRWMFRLDDASPPDLSARNERTGLLRRSVDGFLVLPDADGPEVCVFMDPSSGSYMAEDREGARQIADADVVVAGGDRWRVDAPCGPSYCFDIGRDPHPRLRIGVTRNEARVEATLTVRGCVSALPRSSHRLLLLLARAQLVTAAAPPAERGWVDRESLSRMLGIDPLRLSVDVCRLRAHVDKLLVGYPCEVISRQPNTGRLRLGTLPVEVTQL
jgi:hypothetical protein